MSGLRTAALGLLLLGAGSGPAGAQDSHFGIRSLGTPERWESVRARATGGAFAAFDAQSSVADAALAGVRRLTAYAAAFGSQRTVTMGGEDFSLRTSRVPTVVVAGPLVGPIAVAGGFTGYLSRSFRVVTRDSVVIRGVQEPFTDEMTSDGGVADVRLAAGARITRALAVGASLHLLPGSTRQTMVRRFDDSVTYRNAAQIETVSFDGLGGAASVLIEPGTHVRLAGWVRADTRLRYESADSTGTYDLPLAAGGALFLQPVSEIALAISVDWRQWSSTAGLSSFDTFGWSVGAELGNPARPLRLGLRRGQLPFGPGASAPTEFAVAVGTGLRFSADRGVIDFGIERLIRDGAGVREAVWTVLAGVTVRP
jgi:hypothetical protein